MAEKFTPKFTPYLASDVFDKDGVPGWASRVKAALKAHAHHVRVSSSNEIEACSPLRMVWQPIMLPNGGTQFENLEEAGRVLRMVKGDEEIPNVVTVKPPEEPAP